MARRIYPWLPSLIVLALNACGGTDSGFFSNVVTAGAGGSNQPGPSPSAGSNSGSPGRAGAANNAGAPSSAGAPGSAGRNAGGDGSGGAHAAGASSGGRAGASSGGAPGNAGAGGSASGGRPGMNGGAANAGAAGSNSEDCSDLIKQANEQLEAARECRMDVDALQCTGKVTTPCNCQVPVQRSESPETKAYLKTLKLIEEKKCVTVCTAVACAAVTNAQCRASGTSVMGTCVASNRGPTP